MARYLLALVLVLGCGCSRFARVDGYSHRALNPYVDVVAGGRIAAGPVTIEATHGWRYGAHGDALPLYGVGGSLEAGRVSVWVSLEWEHGDDDPGIFFGAEVDL